MLILKTSGIPISDEEILNSIGNIRGSEEAIPMYNKKWGSKESLREVYNNILQPKQLKFTINDNKLTYN